MPTKLIGVEDAKLEQNEMAAVDGLVEDGMIDASALILAHAKAPAKLRSISLHLCVDVTQSYSSPSPIGSFLWPKRNRFGRLHSN